MDKLKLMLAKGLFFDRPRLDLPPTVYESSAIDKGADLEFLTQLWDAVRYRTLLDLFRKQIKREDKLFCLAWWLYQEKVCQPEDILGNEELRRMAKKKFRFLSFSDLYHAERVRRCLPYFKKLLTDSRTYKGDVSKLVKRGYKERAILAASKKRSAVPAACDWLAGCDDSGSKVDALTLQNAYSRVYGPKRRSAPKSHTSQ
jgi:hypothetical protein